MVRGKWTKMDEHDVPSQVMQMTHIQGSVVGGVEVG